jgi:hypothetical protein
MLARLVLVLSLGLVVLPTCGGDDCPAGSVRKQICTRCGPAGGCEAMAETCVKLCDASTACGPGTMCIDGECLMLCL